MIAKLMTGLAAGSIAMAPVAATAAPVAPTTAASKLSLSNAPRAGTATAKADRLAGVSIIPAIIGAAVVVGVALLIIDNEDDDDSDSN
ncbi:hypothetical protein F1C10_12005 [Sphingomonas sp. NBWT7]|uniref:hypothetical protein n=1 Tax=Sphingomonas sp. NBWT7 TaxID=2596913 RepID=UPI0016299BB1|nr:hypothetical protein [Sphingomonas sp. NBWT7]QNE32595.1 hypothetical protein F1C10_12005 [Sphingomonas sp. NBWT7]